jgi:hypothetical protein
MQFSERLQSRDFVWVIQQIAAIQVLSLSFVCQPQQEIKIILLPEFSSMGTRCFRSRPARLEFLSIRLHSIHPSAVKLV